MLGGAVAEWTNALLVKENKRKPIVKPTKSQFKRIKENSDPNVSFEVLASMCEVYNEKV